jgi:hypothetical protein
MPKPNYQFEKRKRDMDKKAKKEEKRLKKLQGESAPATPEGESAEPGPATTTTE